MKKQKNNTCLTTEEVSEIIFDWHGSYSVSKHNDRIMSVDLHSSHPCQSFKESQSLKKRMKQMYPHPFDVVLDNENGILTMKLRVTKERVHDFLKSKRFIQTISEKVNN